VRITAGPSATIDFEGVLPQVKTEKGTSHDTLGRCFCVGVCLYAFEQYKKTGVGRSEKILKLSCVRVPEKNLKTSERFLNDYVKSWALTAYTCHATK
jgi:hypothetical protein